jgi:hypothetical protein
MFLCVCVSAEENLIALVLRVEWPKEPNVFWKTCADFHFPFFQFLRDCFTYKIMLFCSFLLVSSRKSITAGCVMYICVYKNGVTVHR